MDRKNEFGLAPFFGGLLSDYFNSKNRLFDDFDLLENSGFVDNGDHYTAHIEIPGKVNDKHINVEIEKRILTLKYEYKDENSQMSGSFSYSLPEDSDEKTVNVEYDGEKKSISVTVNKLAPVLEEPKKKKIEIKVK